ncbi:hypothetical protein [Streptomyces sp. NPDC058869]|uniref:hypothetical protein n=1 Tax=Streptomyces sp. NPDC058869 TaxID=3346659 RepID=UPI0036BD30C1
MDGQWAVVVGAALGASGAVVGAITSWAGAGLQARAHVEVAQLQQSAAHAAETTARRRAAYSDLILSVDAARRQMRIVRQHVHTSAPGVDELRAEQATVHDRIREMQAAEWVLRLMLPDDEQTAVTDLTNAVYASHHALIEDVDAWLEQAPTDGARTPSGTPRYDGKTSALQSQMMSFAGSAHARLYT